MSSASNTVQVTKVAPLGGPSAPHVKYVASVQAFDGKLYFPPFTADTLLRFDPQTREQRPIASLGNANCKYACIAAHSNGKLYCPPFSGDTVLVVDVVKLSSPPYNAESATYDVLARAVERIKGTLSPGKFRYENIVEALDGNLYCAPAHVTRCLKINPVEGTVEEFGAPLPEGPGKFRDMKRGRNGNLYSPPLNANRVLKIDPVKGTAELVGQELGYGVQTGDCLGPGHAGPNNDKWWAVEVGNNGKLYAPPCNALRCLEIDPETDEVKEFGGPWEGDNKWGGVIRAYNGKIYCAPRFNSRVLKIDPEACTAELIGSDLGDGGDKWSSIAQAADGKLYCAPRCANNLLRIDPATDTTEVLPAKVGSDGKVKWQWMNTVASSTGPVLAPPGFAEDFLIIDP
jgi:streptogramin lyase